jgi:hypothetical protein
MPSPRGLGRGLRIGDPHVADEGSELIERLVARREVPTQEAAGVVVADVPK